MINLVSIGGSGDAYLVCALFEQFRLHHGRRDVCLVTKAKYACIAEYFGVPFRADDALVLAAERSFDMQRSYENVLLAPETTFYVHPCFERSGVRVDKLTTKPEASQADMYRMILRLPLEAPLAIPTRLPDVPQERDMVVMIPDAISWPNTQPAFWAILRDDLQRIGKRVITNDERWPFSVLMEHCARAEWVIGPQCGVMSILVTGRFPCRKTLCSARLDDANKKLAFLSAKTFPYAYVTKFSNTDYDVEEFEITDHNHAELTAAIVNGINAQRLRPYDPRPVTTIQCPLSPGDYLDRLAVLEVKRRRFAYPARAGIEREYSRFLALRDTFPLPPEAEESFRQLVGVHEATYDLLARLVPAGLRMEAPSAEDHAAQVRLNRDRVRLRGVIDALCRAPYGEVKDYYDDGGA